MKRFTNLLLAAMLILGTTSISTEACTRAVYTTKKDTVIVGRTMDWAAQESPYIRKNPRGVKYKSTNFKNGLTWTSKYGSVVISGEFKGANSGVNEKGLEVDCLWLDVSNYGKLSSNEKAISIVDFPQYLLDNFSTVNEVINFLKTTNPRIVLGKDATILGTELRLHFVATDKTGNNVLIEYIDGKVNLHNYKGRFVVTNDPEYTKMTAIKDYFEQLGIGRNMPGSSLSEARFVYTTGWLNQFTEGVLPGYIEGINDKSFDEQAVMSVLSLMRGVSTPLGVEIEGDPNNTSTLWRTVTDLKNNKFYFDSALTMATMWVDYTKLDYSKTKELPLKGKSLFGDITELLNK